jgi:hypothetical protein
MRRKPLFPPPQEVTTGTKLRNKGRQDYSVATINGRIFIQRIRWHSPIAGSCTIIDRYLDQAEQTISVNVREMVCRFNGAGTNFDRTAEDLKHGMHLEISGESLRQLVESEGQLVVKAMQAGTLPITWSAKDCISDPEKPGSSTRLYLGSDGVMTPMVTQTEKTKRREQVKQKRSRRGRRCQPLRRAKAGADQKYKEFKIVTYYDEPLNHRIVFGTRGNHEEAGRVMTRLAKQIDLPSAHEKVGNVDGAPWIRNQIEGRKLGLDALGLDFYHLAEQVHKARRVVFGEADELGTTWAGELLHVFKHDGYDAAWNRLVGWRVGLRGGKRAAADALMHYVSERREMIRYPEFASKGWSIGSGPTESCCKTLTKRLKGSGMRWDGDNAEAVMALESLRESGLWKAYWQKLIPATT